MNTSHIEKRLDEIEAEIKQLREELNGAESKEPYRKLSGILGPVGFTEEEIDKARGALFRSQRTDA